MRKLMSSIFLRVTLTSLAIFCCSCSRQAKKEGHLKNADSNFSAGHYAEAEIEYMNVLQLEPLNPQAITRLGLIYSDQGRLGRVIPFLVKGKELQPENLEVRLKLGLMLASNGNYKSAQDEANFILDRKPLDLDAPLLLADTANNPDAVAVAMKRLQSLPPAAATGTPVQVALGALEFKQRHAKEAEIFFKRAIAQDPKSAAAQAAIGTWHRTQNDLPNAESAFKRASELAGPYSPQQLVYAKFKLQTGDAETARRALQEITVKTPDYLPAWILLAELTAAEKKYPESGTLVAKVLARDPAHPEALLLSARLKLAQGENDKAVAEMEKMIKFYPQSPQANYQLAVAYVATGEAVKAILSLNQALTLSPGYIEATVLLADLNLRKGDFNAAISALKPLIQQRPDVVQAPFLLADAYRSQGNLDGAVAVYRKIEELFPRNAQAPYWRGTALLQQKKRDEARQAFAKALELSPDFLLALEQLVNFDLAEKNFPTAHQRVQSQITRDPKQSSPYLLQAKIFLAQGDVPHTESSLRKAIEIQPDSPLAYLLLARLYATSHQLEQALANFQSVTAKNPKDIEALIMTATLFNQKGNFPAARETYEKLLVVNPRFVPALNDLAYLYSEQFNDLDKAQVLVQKARELLPHEPHTGDTLGWILYRKRQYPWALSLLLESSAKLPDSAEVQFHLGMTHYMMGNEEPALNALQRALQLDKNFPGSDEASQCLSILAIDPQTAGASGLANLEKIIASRPDDPVALARLAATYTAAGAFDQAAAAYQNALQKSPNNTTVMIALAQFSAAHHDTAKALELAKNARKLAPDDGTVALTLGRLAYESGDYEWSLSLLQEATRKSPDDPEALYALARATYSVGRVADAEAAMQRSLQTKSVFTHTDEAQRFLAMIALATNPTSAEAGQIDQILKSNPNDVPALFAKAALGEQSSATTEAEAIYEKVLTLFPDFTPAKKRLVILYSENPADNQKALNLAVKTREALPNDAEVSKAFGLIVYRMGDFTKASSLLKESAKQRPKDAELLYYLGAAQAKLKQTADSRQSLQRALELNLKADLANDAQRILKELK